MPNNNETMRMNIHAYKAFTLIELLVVMAVIMLLAGLLMPAFSYARTTAKRAKAKNEVWQVEVAWRSVLTDYEAWTLAGLPPSMNVNVDCTMDSAAVNYLRGGNSKNILYIELPASATSLNDPWGTAYHFMLGNGQVQPPNFGVFYRDVGAWSYGENKSSASTNRWLVSW